MRTTAPTVGQRWMVIGMNKDDKLKIKKMLDSAVGHYIDFKNCQNGNDRPCIAREVLARQATVFTLADYLFHNGFISYEEWCEYLGKVDMTDEDESCSYKCGANIDGKCKYAVNRNKAATALLMEG